MTEGQRKKVFQIIDILDELTYEEYDFILDESRRLLRESIEADANKAKTILLAEEAKEKANEST